MTESHSPISQTSDPRNDPRNGPRTDPRNDSRNDPRTDPRIDMDAKLAAEIEEALGDMSLEDMLDEADRPKSARADRDRRTGTVMQVHGQDVFVEFGPKSQGICPLSMFPEAPKLGDRLEFIIERFDKDDGLLILSREGKITKAAWESLEVGQTVEARCTGTNKGGLEMEVAGHKAFMPAGQVDVRHIADLNVFVGEKMPCEVIEVDRQRGRIILSRRSTMQAERAEMRQRLLSVIEVGMTMPAVITTLQPYGAFADMGGLDGLIHISDISYERLKHPSEVLKEGQHVQVKVLKIDTSHDPPKIGLGLKQMMDDPRAASLSTLKEGDTVSGRVTKIMPFGAFVEISPGVDGLVHISEISHERVHNINKALKTDEVITCKVVSIDQAKRKVALSIKALKSKEDHEAEIQRKEDAKMNRLRSQLNKKFGPLNLKGGIG
jgi:ribosomal protein S1